MKENMPTSSSGSSVLKQKYAALLESRTKYKEEAKKRSVPFSRWRSALSRWKANSSRPLIRSLSQSNSQKQRVAWTRRSPSLKARRTKLLKRRVVLNESQSLSATRKIFEAR